MYKLKRQQEQISAVDIDIYMHKMNLPHEVGV